MKQLSVSKGMMTQEEADHYEAEYRFPEVVHF